MGLTQLAAAPMPSILKINQSKTTAPCGGHKESNMALQEWSMELLTVVLALLDDADPKSAAAIKARQLLATKITD